MPGIYQRVDPSTLKEDDDYNNLWDSFKLNELLFDIYNYYYNKGFVCIILKHVLFHIAQFGFLAMLVIYINTCIHFENIFTNNTVSPNNVYSCNSSFSDMNWFMRFFVYILLGVMLYNIVKLPFMVRKYWKIKTIYSKLFGITEEELQTISFSDIVAKIKEIDNSSGSYKITELDIINIIMRKENYMIAIFNKDVINFQLPFVRYEAFNQLYEWIILLILDWTIFNSDQTLRHRAFIMEREYEKIKKVIRWGSLGLLIFSPFIFIYLLTYFIFKYAETIKQRPGLLTTREWTRVAKKKFRDFNELPHLFERRMSESYKHAVKYMGYFDNYRNTLIAKFAIFMIASVLSIFIILTVINTVYYLLIAQIGGLSVKIDASLLFVLTLLGSLLGIVQMAIPHTNKVRKYNTTMHKIAKAIHFIPENWIKEPHTEETRKEFSKMFPFKVYNWLNELLGVLVTPFLLVTRFTKEYRKVVEFITSHSVYHQKIGYICEFAVFELEKIKHPDNTGMSDMENHKLELSIINFNSNYPEWVVDPQKQEFVDQVTDREPDIEAPPPQKTLFSSDDTDVIDPLSKFMTDNNGSSDMDEYLTMFSEEKQPDSAMFTSAQDDGFSTLLDQINDAADKLE